MKHDSLRRIYSVAAAVVAIMTIIVVGCPLSDNDADVGTSLLDIKLFEDEQAVWIFENSNNDASILGAYFKNNTNELTIPSTVCENVTLNTNVEIGLTIQNKNVDKAAISLTTINPASQQVEQRTIWVQTVESSNKSQITLAEAGDYTSDNPLGLVEIGGRLSFTVSDVGLSKVSGEAYDTQGNRVAITPSSKIDMSKNTLVKTYNDIYNVVHIADYAFVSGPLSGSYIYLGSVQESTNFVKVVFQQNLISIGNYAFEGFTYLKEIDLQNADVQVIGDGAFNDCGPNDLFVMQTADLNSNVSEQNMMAKLSKYGNKAKYDKQIPELGVGTNHIDFQIKEGELWKEEKKKNKITTPQIGIDLNSFSGGSESISILGCAGCTSNNNGVTVEETTKIEVSISNIVYEPSTRTVSFDFDSNMCVDSEGHHYNYIIVAVNLPDDCIRSSSSGYNNEGVYSKSATAPLRVNMVYKLINPEDDPSKYLTLKLSSSVEEIGELAFPRVQKLIIPENSRLEQVGSGAFGMANPSLGTVVFPSTLNSVGEKFINPAADFDIQDGGRYQLLQTKELIEASTNKVIMYFGDAEDYSLPDTVTSVANYAYKDAVFSKVTIRDGIEWGLFPFEGANISTIDMTGISSIPDYLFGKSRIENITISSNVNEIGVKSFYAIEGLTTVTFADQSELDRIDSYAFSSNTSLTTVNFGTFKDGYSCYIDDAAFFDCNSLLNVSLTDSTISYVGNFAFAKYGNTASSQPVNFGSDHGILLPSTVTFVGGFAFGQVNGIKSASSSEPGINTIVTPQFANSVLFPEQSDYDIYVAEGSQLTQIEADAFRGIVGIGTVDLSKCVNLETIGSNAFRYCDVKTLVLPEGRLTELRGFSGNDCVTDVYLGEVSDNRKNMLPDSIQSASNIESLKSISFSNNSDLTSLVYSGRLEGSNDIIDLSSCNKLERVDLYGTVTLPKGVYEINTRVTGWTITNSNEVIATQEFLLDSEGKPVIEDGQNVYVSELEISSDTKAINSAILGNKDITIVNNSLFVLERGMLVYDPQGKSQLVTIQKNVETITIDNDSIIKEIKSETFRNTSLKELYINKAVVLGEKIFAGIDINSNVSLHINESLNLRGDELDGDYASLTLFIGESCKDMIPLVYDYGDIYVSYIQGDDQICLPYDLDGVKTFTVTKTGNGNYKIALSGGYTLYDLDVVPIHGTCEIDVTSEEMTVSNINSVDGYLIVDLMVADRHSADDVSVLFKANGGSIQGKDSYTVAIKPGLTLLDSDIPLVYRDGFEFLNWTASDGSILDDTSQILEDTVFMAQWGGSRDPVLFIDTFAGDVMVDGSIVKEFRDISKQSVSLTFVPHEGYEVFNWTVDGIDMGSVELPLNIPISEKDVHVSVSYRYYASSSGLPSVINTETPNYENMYLTSFSYLLGGAVNTSGYVWTGTASVPLIVDNNIYFRAGDWLYKVESDTGYVVKKVPSKDPVAFYHQLGYGSGLIVDYSTGNVYNLDLELEYTLASRIEGAEYYNGYFYTSGKTLYRFHADASFAENGVMELEKVGKFSNSVYSSYGFSSSVFVGDYIYRIYAEGSNRGIVSMCINGDDFGQSDYLELPGLRSHYLDDGWISYNNGYIYVTGYSDGLFGAVATIEPNVIAYASVDGLQMSNPQSIILEGERSFTGKVVFTSGYAFLNTTKFHMYEPQADGSLVELCNDTGTYSHGGLVVSDRLSDSNQFEAYVIPYSTFGLSTKMVTYHMYMESEGIWKINRVDDYHMPSQYNSQAVRSDAEGRLIWYNDSGKISTFATPEKNPYYFFIDDGTQARWHVGYGKNMYEAARTLGSQVLSVDNAFEVSKIFGKAITNISMVAVHATTNTIMEYEWTSVDSFNNRKFDTDHYIIIAAGDANVQKGSVYTYWDGSAFKTYSFKENIGDRSLIGVRMVPGNSASLVQFFEGDVEIDDSYIIGIVGSDVLGDFPRVYKDGYLPVWKDSSGTEVISLEGTKFVSGGAIYKLFWEKIQSYEIAVTKTDVKGDNLTLEYTIETTDESELNIQVQAAYSNMTFVREPIEAKIAEGGKIVVTSTITKESTPVKALVTVYKGNILVLAEYIDLTEGGSS